MICSAAVVPVPIAVAGKSTSSLEFIEASPHNSPVVRGCRSHALWNFLCKPSEMVNATELQDEGGRGMGVNRYSGPRLISFRCAEV